MLKKELNEWWEVGGFGCCDPGTQVLDPFIEVKDIVWYGTKDIIVHQVGAHGTSVGEMRLLIYRMLRGRLYKVFDAVESSYNLSGSESTRIVYPDLSSQTGPRILIIHRVAEADGRRSETCHPYRWNSVRFAFIRSSAAEAQCGPVK